MRPVVKIRAISDWLVTHVEKQHWGRGKKEQPLRREPALRQRRTGRAGREKTQDSMPDSMRERERECVYYTFPATQG